MRRRRRQLSRTTSTGTNPPRRICTLRYGRRLPTVRRGGERGRGDGEDADQRPHLRFQVRAVNAVGASDPSEAARAVAGDGLGICDRSLIVQAPTLAAIAGVSNCADVTPAHLSAITGSLDVAPLKALKVGDFDGLSSLEELYLQSGSQVTELPAGIFDDLSSLTKLQVGFTGIATLQPDVFSNLSSLTTLVLSFNALTVLPAGVFDGCRR